MVYIDPNITAAVVAEMNEREARRNEAAEERDRFNATVDADALNHLRATGLFGDTDPILGKPPKLAPIDRSDSRAFLANVEDIAAGKRAVK